MDYFQTFSPTAKLKSMRTLLSIAAVRDYEAVHFDVSTAFLNGTLDEEVYMDQPEGFETGTDDVCHLRKTLYGLKQSPREWYKELKHTFSTLGLYPSKNDASVFIADKKRKFYVGVYVDDMLIITPSKDKVAEFYDKINSIYTVKNLGPVEKLLGIRVRQDRKLRKMWLDQETYARNIVKTYNLDILGKRSVPVSSLTKLQENALNDPEIPPGTPYQQLIGSLMYLAQGTRPDIAFAVGLVSRYLVNPRESHWKITQQIGEYVASTLDYCIVYSGRDHDETLVGYADADWANDVDTRRSVSGFVFLLGGGAISWHSKRQQLVAWSTTEAEYISASEAAAEAIWLRGLLEEIDCTQGAATTIYEDSQGARYLAENDRDHSRTKHMDVRHHFLHERVKMEQVWLAVCRSTEMAADALTKATGRDKFAQCRQMFRLCQWVEVL